MSKLNYEITLYHSPYHDSLVEELSSIIKQKKNIYRNIQSESDYADKLTFEEKEILKHLISKEDSILLELIEHKGWLNRFDDLENLFNQKRAERNRSDDDYDMNAYYSGF